MSARGGRAFAGILLAAAGALAATHAGTARAAEPAPVRVLLVGDSTMAPETGYGNALCRRLKPNVTCLNLAKGGRSSASYRAEGLWDHVIDLLRKHGSEARPPGQHAAYRATYVLIQFGHNDQPGKPGRSTDLVTEFPANMARYAQQVKALHAVPVLVTPLARRSFKGKTLPNDLRPWAAATIRAASAEQVPVLDLNADSWSALEAMGSAEADTLAMAPPVAAVDQEAANEAAKAEAKRKGENYRGFDYTHLGVKGAAFFSKIVAQELRVALPELTNDFNTEK